jgi:Pyruvate/2-oxoacid:ferredoxin oxidoreductase delta subunit
MGDGVCDNRNCVRCAACRRYCREEKYALKTFAAKLNNKYIKLHCKYVMQFN